jgi:putative tryptophan/tyrosine transport system substrate-binding protein
MCQLAGVIPAPLTAWGQERGKIWRIGFLHPARPKPSPEEMARNVFFVALQELGWGEGRNVLYEWRSAQGQLQLFPSLAAELVTAKVDLIQATSSPATRAAKQATATIPIVFTEVGMPVRQGLVVSLGRPGGNLTGFADVSLELMPKRLELLKQLVPRAVRVAVLVNPESQFGSIALPDGERAAPALGLQLETFQVSPATDLDGTFARIRQSRAEALTIVPDALFFVLRAGRVPGLVEKRSGAFFRLVKCTTNAPPCRAATGGTRHGQGYQQASRSA